MLLIVAIALEVTKYQCQTIPTAQQGMGIVSTTTNLSESVDEDRGVARSLSGINPVVQVGCIYNTVSAVDTVS